MTFEQYVNKLSELNKFIEGVQSPDAFGRIADFFVTVLAFALGLVAFSFVFMIISLMVVGICHLVGIGKKLGDTYCEYGASILGFLITVGLFWMMIYGHKSGLPFDSERYNVESNAKFEQTTKLVYNQLIEMSDDEFSQLAKANKSYALSDEQYREYRVVRQLIQEAKRNRKD